MPASPVTSLARMVGLAARFPRAALAAVALVASAAGVAASGLDVDNSLAVWFVEGDPALVAYHDFLHTFENDEVVVVAYRPAREADRAADARRLMEGIGAIDGIESVAPWTPAPETDPAVVALVARLSAEPGVDARRGEILDGVEEIARTATLAPGERVRMSGMGVVAEGLNRQTLRESAIFLTVATLLMLAMLRLLLPGWSPVLVSLVGPVVGSVVSLGLLAVAGRPMSMVNAILPTLVLVLGLAGALHLVVHALRAGGDRDARVEAIVRMAGPYGIAAVTTALGLGAFAFVRIAVVRDLGIFAAVSIVITWVVTVTAVMAALTLWAPRSKPAPLRLAAALAGLGAVAVRRRPVVLGAAVVVTLLGVAGTLRIQVDTDVMGLLPDGHPVREDVGWIERHLGAHTPLEFVFRADAAGDALEPEFRARVREWASAAWSRPDVERVVTAGEGEVPSALRSPDGSALRATALVPMQTAQGFAVIMDALERDADRILGPAPERRASGYMPLYVRIISYTVESTVRGLLLAFITVFVVIALFVRSTPMLGAAIASNLVALALVFGAMGWAGIPLDIATATIGAVVLGIAVDDTVHLLTAFRRAIREGLQPPDAAAAAVEEAGRGMLVSTMVLVVGFSALLLAGSLSIVYFGLLMALALLGALVADLLLLPALLAGGGYRSAAAARPASTTPGQNDATATRRSIPSEPG